MDPIPTANPYAELVTEGFEECRPPETPARKWSSPMPLEPKRVEGSERRCIRQPAINQDTDHPREDGFADVLFEEGYEEGSVRETRRVWLPGLADGGDITSQGQQTSVFEDTEKLSLARGCTLPSLKDLGLDIYFKRRIDDSFGGWDRSGFYSARALIIDTSS